MKDLTKAQELENKLLSKSNKFECDSKILNNFSNGYKEFLSNCKTERECFDYAMSKAKENGFKSIDEYDKLSYGDKVYLTNRGKALILAVIGKEDITKGVNIVGSHIDAPRLDLKPNPLYEDSNLALFKTHYYGGIKKYQWTSIPLALHGIIYTKNNEKVEIVIGEKDDEPVFTITDLLPHLGNSQMSKKMSEGIEGEKLNILIGSTPITDDEVKEKVKLNIMNILNEKYSIIEDDFKCAELEVVPAFGARDVGFDLSMVGSYGQDDRVCAYTSLQGILEINNPPKTAICLLVDKEEIGSMGNTGMKSRFLEDSLALLCYKSVLNYNDIILRTTMQNSMCLSADVGAAFDPNYPEVNETKNTAYLNKGVLVMKYTGARGKSGSSDCNAEFMSKIRQLFDKNEIIWQIGELGKVDEGGGGTIAQYVANLSIDVVDCGTPILSMHSPFEIASKYDIYMSYKAYKAFYGLEN